MKTKLILTILVCGSLSGCSVISSFCEETPTPTRTVVSKRVVVQENVRGTVTKTWAEPMNDTIKVQGQIDPSNTYYIAPHQEVVEIRDGKYSETRYDNERK